MNKKEAIKAMLDGKKVRRRYWPEDKYLVMNERGVIVDEDNSNEDINLAAFYVWEIYEEPKKKVTMYKFAYDSCGPLVESRNFYRTEEDLLKVLGSSNYIKRLDYTATEFEIKE